MTDFKGKLGNYKVILTEDKTETVWSEFFNEACHNLSGAYEETIHNYIHGCQIPELLATKDKLSVLDVGFGVGIGLKALIDSIKNNSSKIVLVNYFSIELDEQFFLWTLNRYFLHLNAERITDSNDIVYYRLSDGSNKITASIFIGDGRKTLPVAYKGGLLPRLDAIFQDPFSPKKNPDLWTVEWFEFLKNISNPNVRMSTYSSSISIRKSMIAAGWIIENSLGFAQKRTMTKAALFGETSPELLLQLQRSPSLELHDK